MGRLEGNVAIVVVEGRLLGRLWAMEGDMFEFAQSVRG